MSEEPCCSPPGPDAPEWSADVVITVPDTEHGRAAALLQLEEELAGTGAAEVWVAHDAFPSACALVNGDLGWLMVLRYAGDAGFSSRNPRYGGPAEALLEYRLANGQVDKYPASWAYPRDILITALTHFVRHRTMPAGICWYNDSDDGRLSPNEAFADAG